MPLIKSASREATSKNIKAELAIGKPQKQAIAIALDVARRARKARADGGETDDVLLPLPRNPARAPEAVENAALDMTVNPIRDAVRAAKGQLTDAEAQDFAMTAAAGLIPMGRGLKAAKTGIKAYHGSPHDFDRFDMSKIGTGEGAQVYGHGLYFAENEAVARNYRDVLGGRGAVYVGGKRLPNRPSSLIDDYAQQRIRSAAQKSGVDDVLGQAVADQQRYINSLREHAVRAGHEGGTNHSVAHAEQVLARLEEWGRGKLKTPTPGRMYEVNINASPEQFLDWDKPLSKMSPTVQDALHSSWLAHREDHARQTGEQIYRNNTPGFVSSGPYKEPSHAEASAILREAGIPGIKYLDQGSRFRVGGEHVLTERKPNGMWEATIRVDRDNLGFAGPGTAFTKKQFQTKEAADAWAASEINQQGTRNYVVFDDKLIDILRKYGVGSVAALPPAVQASLGLMGDEGVKPKANGGALQIAYAARRERGGSVHIGPIVSEVPGRTDRHEMEVPAGAYVIPSEAVSNLGENNTLAGLKTLREVCAGSPEQIRKFFGASGLFNPQQFARGGQIAQQKGDGQPTPVVVAGGEYVVPHQIPSILGNGDTKLGHKVLDAWVMKRRKNHIKTLKSLPPPARD